MQGLTENMAKEQQIVSARLPVPETMSRSNKDQGGHIHLPLDIGIIVLNFTIIISYLLSYSCRDIDDCVFWEQLV